MTLQTRKKWESQPLQLRQRCQTRWLQEEVELRMMLMLLQTSWLQEEVELRMMVLMLLQTSWPLQTTWLQLVVELRIL